MEIAFAIISIGVLVFLAHFFAWLFSFVRIPDVLLLMCIGILVGPLLGIVSPDFLGDSGNIIVMVALVMILFEGAMSLKISSLKNAALGTLALAVSSFFLSMFGVGFLLWLVVGMPSTISFLIGAIVGSNSTALVIPIIQKLKICEDSRTTLVLESGITDVLSIVFALAFITSLEIGSFHLGSVIKDILSTLFGAAILGSFLALLWSVLLGKVHNIQNSAFATPAFVFIVFGTTEALGYSGLIAVIAFGVILGNIPLFVSSIKERYHSLYEILHPEPLSTGEFSFLRETVFLIKIFFFLFIGISLNFENFYIIALGFLLALFIFIVRIPAILFSVSRSTSKFDASVMAVTAPRGLAPAILALIPIQKGLQGGQAVQDITYSVIFFSILLASLLIFLIYNTKVKKLYEVLLCCFSANKEEQIL